MSQDPVAASVSQKQLVIQLRQLAQDPEHQAALVDNNNCLRSLVQTLQAIDSETVIIALQTLFIISQTPHHRPTLLKVNHLVRSVDLLRQSPNPRVSDLARNLHDTLQASDSSRQTLHAPRQLHTIHLKIVNLKTQQDRDEIARIAVTIPGVVSATTDTRTQKATFYTTRDDIRLKLIHSVRERGFQVDDNSDGDDNSVYIDDNVSVASGVESVYSNFTGPTYVEPRSFQSRTAITRYQPERKVETLRQRLEREKLEKQEQEAEREKKAESWVGYAVSWIW